MTEDQKDRIKKVLCKCATSHVIHSNKVAKILMNGIRMKTEDFEIWLNMDDMTGMIKDEVVMTGAKTLQIHTHDGHYVKIY